MGLVCLGIPRFLAQQEKKIPISCKPSPTSCNQSPLIDTTDHTRHQRQARGHQRPARPCAWELGAWVTLRVAAGRRAPCSASSPPWAPVQRATPLLVCSPSRSLADDASPICPPKFLALTLTAGHGASPPLCAMLLLLADRTLPPPPCRSAPRHPRAPAALQLQAGAPAALLPACLEASAPCKSN